MLDLELLKIFYKFLLNLLLNLYLIIITQIIKFKIKITLI